MAPRSNRHSVFGPPMRRRRTTRFAGLRIEQLEGRIAPALFNVQNAVTVSPTGNYGCLATGDFNGDGNTDMVLTNYGTAAPGNSAGGNVISVLLGNGNGTFGNASNITLGTNYYVSFVAVGDLNGDSKLDLAVASTIEDSTGRLSIFLGTGSGGFTPSGQNPISTGSSNTCWVGIAQVTNGDSNADVVVAGFGDSDQGQTTVFGNNIAVFQGDGTGAVNSIGTITNGLAFIPTAMAIADFDGDGDMDFAATVPGVPPDAGAAQPAGIVQLFAGNGAGGFTLSNSFSTGGALPIAIQVAYLNGDALPDLVIANAGDPDSANVYANFGVNSSVGVAMNTGGMNFNTSSITAGLGVSGSKSVFAVTVADFDQDGKQDIAGIVYGHPLSGANARVLEYKGDGNGGFAADANSPYNTQTTDGQYLVAAPLDANATPDIVYSNAVGQYGVLLNTTAVGVSTSTALASSVNPSTSGQSVTFTATVTPASGTATGGTVTFFNGGVQIGSPVNLVNQQAEISTSSLSVGTRSITATYSGATGFAGSTSSVLSQVVNAGQASTSTALASSLNPSTSGQTVTFTATVTAATGTTSGGTVTFFNGGVQIGSPVNLASQQAQLPINTLAVGTHSITASYSGATGFTGSTSSAVSQVVNVTPVSTSTALASSINPSSFGQSTTFTATITAASGTASGGSVTFFDNGVQIGSPVNLTNQQAELPVNTLSVGTHSITATYSGAAGFSGSTSSAVSQVVNSATTSTALASSANPSTFSQSVTFTATVSNAFGSTTGGTVTFFDNDVQIGNPVNLASQQAAIAISNLSVGTHSITATYSGATGFSGSTSSALSQVVGPSTAGTLGFKQAVFNTTEENAAQTMTVWVTRAGQTTGAVSINYTISAGSAHHSGEVAKGQADFFPTTTSFSGTLSWADGVGGDLPIEINILPDLLNEGKELINLDLSILSGGASLGIDSAVVAIAPSDGKVIDGTVRLPTALFRDAPGIAGDLITVRLAGKVGTATVYKTDWDGDGNGPIEWIDLAGTDPAKSSLIITAKKPKGGFGDGRAKLAEVTGTGLKALTAPTTDLDGPGINLDGFLGKLRIGNVKGGADITMAAPPATILRPAVRITAGVIGDGTDITVTGAPLANLTALAVGNGTITAPSVGVINVKGKAVSRLAPAIVGNFNSDLIVTGVGVDPVKLALTKLRAAGSITGANINVDGSLGTISVGSRGKGDFTGAISVTGNLNTVRVAGKVNQTIIDVGGNVKAVVVGSFWNSRLDSGYTGSDDGSGTYDFPTTIGSFRVTSKIDGFQASNVIASIIKSVTLASVNPVNPVNPGTKFGVTAELALMSLVVTSPTQTFKFNPIDNSPQSSPALGDFEAKHRQ